MHIVPDLVQVLSQSNSTFIGKKGRNKTPSKNNRKMQTK